MDATDYTSLEPLAHALIRCARGKSSELLAHIECSAKSVQIGETATTAHSYFLKTNGNGQLVIHELIDFLAEQIIDYALPRRKVTEAKNELEENGSSSLFARLNSEAKRLFTSSDTSGEVGELLLYSFAERIFEFPQLMSKMSLKTSTKMHYHGADGVFAEARNDGGLNLYWGEAKIHKAVNSAIDEAFNSLAPFLLEPRNDTARRSQDIFLLNKDVDLGDGNLTERLKLFFTPNTDEARLIKYCGLALVGFDSMAYKNMGAIADSVAKEFENHKKKLNDVVSKHSLEEFHIHVICLPFSSVEDFRNIFATRLGLRDAA